MKRDGGMRCERDGQNNREMSVRSPQRQTTQFVGEIRELSVDIWTVSQIKKKKRGGIQRKNNSNLVISKDTTFREKVYVFV